MRLAAAEAGIPAFDGALAAIESPERLQAEAEAARQLGFAGKSCIHPSQVPVVNQAFLPTAAEVGWGAARDRGRRPGRGRRHRRLQFDGQMLDAPFIARARAVLALAQRS